MAKSLKQALPVGVALVMLGALVAFGELRIVTEGVDEFMSRSRLAIDAIPLRIDRWEAKRTPLDAQARDLLKPNAEASLLYEHDVNPALWAHYSVIQVSDSRFMTGHAPSNCYPGSGYEITKQVDRVWRIGGEDVKGIEYVVQRPLPDGRMVVRNVRNFFIFPDGHFGATLLELDQAAADYRKLKYGVTQVQFLTAAGITDGQRDEIFSKLVGSEKSLEMILTLRTGIPK
jgi:hypothetical protein